MTPIYSARINHPMAWRGGDFSKGDIAFDLSRKHVAALEDVLLRVRGAGLALGLDPGAVVELNRSPVDLIGHDKEPPP